MRKVCGRKAQGLECEPRSVLRDRGTETAVRSGEAVGATRWPLSSPSFSGLTHVRRWTPLGRGLTFVRRAENMGQRAWEDSLASDAMCRELATKWRRLPEEWAVEWMLRSS